MPQYIQVNHNISLCNSDAALVFLGDFDAFAILIKEQASGSFHILLLHLPDINKKDYWFCSDLEDKNKIRNNKTMSVDSKYKAQKVLS